MGVHFVEPKRPKVYTVGLRIGTKAKNRKNNNSH